MSYRLPASGSIHVGTFIKTTSPQVVEILGGSGLDFAVLDAEHAPFDRAALDLALLAGRAAQLPLFVRVADAAASTLLTALDLGAAGVLVPHVDSEAQAREVVTHCRYDGGDRGYSGSPRAAAYGAMGMKAAIEHGDRSVVVCQIESLQGVEQAARIAAVPGVGGIFIGRADLALSMGLRDSQHEQVLAATDRVIRAGLEAGKAVGMFVGSGAERERYVERGVTWFVQSSDQTLLRQAAQALAQPKAAPTSTRPKASGPA